ncbi:MAG: type II toxin-antitoxin system RelE/ParE family toxin [Chloroflexota bacterium]
MGCNHQCYSKSSPSRVGYIRYKYGKAPIYELRKNRHRILYAQDDRRFILLSAFLKSSQKTPPTEIKLAEKRYQEYLKNHNCFELKLPPPTSI